MSSIPSFPIPINRFVGIYLEGGSPMQFLYWLIFLIAIGIAIFAVQNSSAPSVIIKFLIWKFETSLVYTILGSIVLGILLTLLFWISRALRASFRPKITDQKIPSN
jgi:uncharacterized integral membrane protein